VFPGLTITLWARRPDAAEALAARHPGVRVARDLPAAVAGADLIATCTMAREPVLCGDWLRPGQHIDLIGAYTPDMREADDAVLRRGRLFVDSRATTLGHIGEVMIPMAAGVIGESDVLGDLHDLVAGRAGRRDPGEITVYKNGGGAHLDLMTARMMLARWRTTSQGATIA
jgi:ornithine cyclodeaminase